MGAIDHNRRCAESVAAAQVAAESARQWLTSASGHLKQGEVGRVALSSDLIMSVHTLAAAMEHLAAAMLDRLASETKGVDSGQDKQKG